MDAITAFRAALLSPVFMVAVAILAAVVAKFSSLSKPGVASLMGRSLVYATIGLIVSVGLPIAWIDLYQASFRIGQLFMFGSFGLALGQLVALTHWWFQKPPSHASGPKPRALPVD